ncbi:hypothetical protein F383_21719 [Gossypium arboreum]|nr:hypothetical protein F383_37231 [Gossypium arboreum]KHG15782.1 hypothetical protein F383_22636 [Gossypium arboreum]KHG17970.1 hypothetical protein F383_21719 [Gossypium arboreum]
MPLSQTGSYSHT